LIDYIELDGFRHAVVLGDVAGKGLGASLLSAQLQATLRALGIHAASLDDLASQVNETMLRDGISNRFATLFYAELQYDSGSVRYVNAGHNPALAIHGDRIDRLGASSVPLGMLEGSKYEEVSLNLDPGDTLLIYSDGVTEAENIESEEFGIDRLEALAPQIRNVDPETAGHLILTEIDHFLDGLRPADDLSMVIVRRHDS
jgi:sigma-B regulation protein RsbU (phosphoserine phosphatase)